MTPVSAATGVESGLPPFYIFGDEGYQNHQIAFDGDSLVRHPRVVLSVPTPNMRAEGIVRAIERRARRGSDTVILIGAQDPHSVQTFLIALGFQDLFPNPMEISAAWTHGSLAACRMRGDRALADVLDRFRPAGWRPSVLPGRTLVSVEDAATGEVTPVVSVVDYGRAHLTFVVVESPSTEVANQVSDALEPLLARPEIPDYGEDGYVYGETELVAEIAVLEDKLVQHRSEVEDLRRWRALIGRFDGAAQTTEVVRALDFVLADQGWQSDPVFVDENREDFVFLPEREGAVAIIGNAKSVGGGVRTPHIAQAERHRQEVVDTQDDHESPPHALTVINQFRGSDDLAERRLAVAPNIVRYAVQLRVAVLRAWDLFSLVNRHLASEPFPAEDFTECLRTGGWLQVERDAVTLHQTSPG